MEKKLFVVVLLFGILLAAAWSYKGNELENNQVLVFLTGSDPTEVAGFEEVVEEIPEIDVDKPVEVQINGHNQSCTVTKYTKDSKAIGTVLAGRLEDGVTFTNDHPFLEWNTHVVGKYATTETINSLELASCAVFSKYSTQSRINALNLQSGGRYPPHRTHQNGLDADVALFCTAGASTTHCSDWRRLDAGAAWLFVKTLADKTPVRRVLLSQALINKIRTYVEANEPAHPLKRQIFYNGKNSLLRPDPKHNNHFHVQFHCSKSDGRCTKVGGGFRGAGITGPVIEDADDDEPDEGDTLEVPEVDV